MDILGSNGLFVPHVCLRRVMGASTCVYLMYIRMCISVGYLFNTYVYTQLDICILQYGV